MQHGFVVIDKPVGISSHDVVNRVRRIVGSRSVGHTGTLDPFASGVLVVAVGAATKLIRFLDEERKTYRATARLGETTDTGDLTGTIIERTPCDAVDRLLFERVLASFVGDSLQVPPMYSAVRHNGVKLYELARKGVEVDRSPRPVTIHSLHLDAFDPPSATFVVQCSKGTYVRTLAEDIGRALGCGAHLTALRRLSSGPFTIDHALTLEAFADRFPVGAAPLVTFDVALSHIPPLEIDDFSVMRVLDGLLPARVIADASVDGVVRVVDSRGGLVAVASLQMGGDGRRAGRLLRVFPELCSLQPERGMV